MKDAVDTTLQRTASPFHFSSHPGLSLGLISAAAVAIAAVLIQPWRGSSPFRSSEILIVPTLAAFLLLPAYLLIKLVPDKVFAFGNLLTSTRLGRLLWGMANALLVVGLIWVIFHSLLSAKWGIIDDHEIMDTLGPKGELTMADLPSRLRLTEVGQFGLSQRYRPAYYVLRLLETVVWGRNPTLWYASRVALLASGALLFWLLARRTMGGLGGTLLVAYSLSFPIWADIVGRLGPSEAYALVGLPVYMIGVFVAARNTEVRLRYPLLPGILVLVGGLVCIGAKENLLILVLPTLWLLYLSLRRKQWFLSVCAILVSVMAVVVGTSVYLGTSTSGVDVYGRSISLADRIGRVIEGLLERRLISPFTMLVILTGGLSLLLLLPGMTASKRKAVLRAQAWLGLLCLIYLSQSIFYNGDWPSLGGHYDFPGLLYIPAAIVVLFGLASQLLEGLLESPRGNATLHLASIAAMTLTILFHRGYSSTSAVLRGYVDTSIAFTDNLERLAAGLRQSPTLQVVVEGSGDAWLDFEPAGGLPRFLRAYQVVNPLFLRIHGYTATDFPQGIERRLATRLEQMSLAGDGGYFPIGLLDEAQGACLSIYLESEFPTRCEVFEWRATPAVMPRIR